MATQDRAPYHHGNLRRALLDATAAAIIESGPTVFSLRDVARRAGVSHAAPTHHFHDKTGLLTAFATEGFAMLAADLAAAWESSDHDLLEVGVAYVGFAARHRAHFEVMFRRDLLDADDPAFREAAAAATGPLLAGIDVSLGGVAGVDQADRVAAAIGAWAQAHGLAALWLNGNLPTEFADPEQLARQIARVLDQPH